MNAADIEERLRDALATRAASVDPGDGLPTIERRLRAARRRQLVARATLGLAAAALVAGLTVIAIEDDREKLNTVPPATEPAPPTPRGSTPASTTAPASTAPPPTVPPSTVPPSTAATTTTMADTAAPDGWPAIWPTPGEALFATPDEAALGFARDFLGMGPEANVISSQPTVERPGVLVDIRPRNNGTLITHVQTRAVGDGWVVEATHADNIELVTPSANDSVSSPISLQGRSSTPEGTLYLEARPLGSRDRLGEQIFTMGGAAPDPPAPFTATLMLPPQGEEIIVLVAFQADNTGAGVTDAATAVPVRFTP